MKAYVVAEEFGLDNLQCIERPEPSPGPGQVLVRMRSMSLNYRDLLVVRGHYNPRQQLPLVPLSDGVGVVVGLGPGVDRFSVGERVCPIFAQQWLDGEADKRALRSTLGSPLDGTLRELMVVPEESLVAVPKHLGDAEAAALPCAGVTAWSSLVTQGGVKAGDTVLVQGTGGVSIFALQFAKLLGARVIATSGSDEKLDRVRALGADETINYRSTPEWGRVAKRLAGGDGVDLVVEVGGGGTLEQSLKAVRPFGTISMIGVLAGAKAPVNLLPILMQNVRVQGILVGHRASFQAMNRAIAAHALRPQVDRVFDFGDARSAFVHLASGKHFGKVCIGA